MKKLLTLVLALVGLAVLTDLSVARQKDQEKSPPRSGETKPTPTNAPGKSSERLADAKTSPRPMTGELTAKVTGVDPTARTFTVIFQDRAITFSAARLSKLPAVGENIDIAFTAKPGELPMATSPAEPGSTARATRTKTPLQHCDDHTHGQNPLNSLNVCTY